MKTTPSDAQDTPRKRLTAKAVQQAKPRPKAYKLFDGGGLGLFLFVSPTGAKVWRMKYRFGGKGKLLVLGAYPDLSLADARAEAQEARKQIAKGIDPATEKRNRKAAEAADTLAFRTIALEWLAKFSANWTDGYRHRVKDRFEKQLFPWLATRPIGEITAPELLAVIRRIESRGAIELAHRCFRHCSAVYRYAVATGRAERDPTSDIRGALPPVRAKHHAALTTPGQVGELMRAIRGYQGAFVTVCALRLAPLVFVRPGELRRAEWAEIDLDAGEWRIPAEKMKMRNPHLVPLSRQAVEIIREVQPLSGAGRYVFPSARTDKRPMSENTIGAALRRLGYTKDEMTGHGFRSTASTLLNELGFKPDVIERQLAHVERNSVRAAYNFAEYAEDRRRMMQSWADYLDGLAAGGKVIPIRADQGGGG